MLCDQAAAALAYVGRKGGDVNERRYLRVGACLCDSHATPAMSDKDNGALCVCDNAGRRSEIILETRQGYLHRDDLQILGLQERDDLIPA